MRQRRWPWLVIFGSIAFVCLFHFLGGWYLADQFHAKALAVQAPHSNELATGTITEIAVTDGKGTIVIKPDEEYLDQRQFDAAVMGLTVGDSTVTVGPVVGAPPAGESTIAGSGMAEGSQQRPVMAVDGEVPEAGQAYGLTRDVWPSPRAAGLTHADVVLRSPEGGSFPAWLIPAADSREWAVLLHGKGAGRSEMLRLAKPLNEAGWTVLILGYTNDPGAPSSEDGMFHYGRSEWREVDAAVRLAQDAEAQHVILGGAGHGGAVVLGYLGRGGLASRVSGVFLDSPVSSLRDVLRDGFQYRSMIGLPIPASTQEAAAIFVSARFNVDFSAVDYAGRSEKVSVPMLTYQGQIDGTVPRSVNDRFMLNGSGIGGRYVVVPGADHLMAWNVDPAAYESELKDFLADLKRSTETQPRRLARARLQPRARGLGAV